MELHSIIEAVRALLAQGDTDTAFKRLRLFLEENRGQHADALSVLRILETKYALASQQERKGVLSEQAARLEHNRASDALHALLNDLEAGRKPAVAGRARRRYRALWMGAAAALLLAAAAVWYFRPGYECPKFGSKAGLRVLLVPFQSLSGGRDKPQLVLQERIQELTKKNDLPAVVQILRTYDAETNNPDADAAAEIGGHCGADLVVWGRYSTGDSTRVNVNYIFTGGEMQEGSTGYQAFKDLTQLQSGVMVNRVLEDAIFSVCAVMALRSSKPALAKKWLDKVKEPSAQDLAMLSWVQANDRQ